MTKDYSCEVVVSEVLGKIAELDLSDFAAHDVRVRGRQARVRVYTINSIRELGTVMVR